MTSKIRRRIGLVSAICSHFINRNGLGTRDNQFMALAMSAHALALARAHRKAATLLGGRRSRPGTYYRRAAVKLFGPTTKARLQLRAAVLRRIDREPLSAMHAIWLLRRDGAVRFANG